MTTDLKNKLWCWDPYLRDVVKNKNRRKQNFEDEANNIQWIKKSTNEENWIGNTQG